jgi:hypothetical protein
MLFMKINDTLLYSERCTFFIFLTVKWRLTTPSAALLTTVTKHNLADICDLMVLIFVDNLWKFEYSSDLAIFPGLVIFPTATALAAFLRVIVCKQGYTYSLCPLFVHFIVLFIVRLNTANNQVLISLNDATFLTTLRISNENTSINKLGFHI